MIISLSVLKEGTGLAFRLDTDAGFYYVPHDKTNTVLNDCKAGVSPGTERSVRSSPCRKHPALHFS